MSKKISDTQKLSSIREMSENGLTSSKLLPQHSGKLKFMKFLSKIALKQHRMDARVEFAERFIQIERVWKRDL